ncbi:MAG: hypothetical protein V1694_04035 [Candidatus Eisenbacteria bacterium]
MDIPCRVIKKAIPAIDMALLVRVLGIGFGVLTLLVLYRFSAYLYERTPNKNSFVSTSMPFLLMLVATNFPFAFWSFIGMETSFYLLILLSSVYFFTKYLLDDRGRLRNLLLSSLLLVLATMTRPETYVMPVCYLGFILFREKRDRFKPVALFLLPYLVVFLPYFVWRYQYFGYLFPNTYYSKVAGGSKALSLVGLKYLARGGVRHFVFLAFIASKIIRRGRRLGIVDYYLLALLVAWVGIIIYTGADHLKVPRFFVDMLPFMYLFSFDEIGLFAHWLGERSARTLRMKPRPALKRLTLLVLSVVGAIGYYCNRPIVDMLGIVDPVIAHNPRFDPGKGPKDHNRHDTEYVLSKKPKYIFLRSFAPTEEEFLTGPRRMPAIDILKNYFPNNDHEYMVLELEGNKYALYRRREAPRSAS